MNTTEPLAEPRAGRRGSPAKDMLMRYYPAALALSLVAALTASAGLSAPEPLNPRAAALEGQGRAALAAGDNGAATDLLEAALALQPGQVTIMLDLAEAARQRGMPGKALHYYRVVLTGEPQNIDGLAGEGATLADIGAIDKARRNLAQVEGLCGHDCPAAQTLAAAIAKGPSPRVVAAAAVAQPEVTKN